MIRTHVDIISFKEYTKPYIIFDVLPRVGEHIRIQVEVINNDGVVKEQRTFVVRAILHQPPTDMYGDQETTILFVDEVTPDDNPLVHRS